VCVCFATPKWLKNLSLEYHSQRRDNRFFFDIQSGAGKYFATLVEDGFLRRLPENVCDYPHTAETHFLRNKIKTQEISDVLKI
jgi:hypothetical protein